MIQTTIANANRSSLGWPWLTDVAMWFRSWINYDIRYVRGGTYLTILKEVCREHWWRECAYKSYDNTNRSNRARQRYRYRRDTRYERNLIADSRYNRDSDLKRKSISLAIFARENPRISRPTDSNGRKVRGTPASVLASGGSLRGSLAASAFLHHLHHHFPPPPPGSRRNRENDGRPNLFSKPFQCPLDAARCDSYIFTRWFYSAEVVPKESSAFLSYLCA
jgi:hypothetical protein